MPRRRRVDDAGSSITSEHLQVDPDLLKPTLNRFAEDTSMLGFRYLHTRYKTWFRILWAFILVFFLGLTLYQVFDRISYYFIRNPLKTLRTYDTPTEMPFPTVIICNKLQLKASAMASLAPSLLSALALLSEDDGSITNDKNLIAQLGRFENVSIFDVYSKAHQKMEDLVISCEYGKSRSCLDDIRPIFTPKGVCFEVAPNMTVRRPGPETTLSLLLNLEVNEVIPGTVAEPGVMIGIYDHKESPSSVYSEGIHLEAGKVVTIPINDVRKLFRYESECGRRGVGPFKRSEYSRGACQWVHQTEAVEKTCGCRPLLSPHHRKHLFGDDELPPAPHMKKRRRVRPQPVACSIRQEYECALNVTVNFPLVDHLECPEDCQDVSFSSVVFGGRLNPNDIESLLPSDWDDIKERKIEDFQPALELIANHRIPVVRSVQQLSNEAKQFLDSAIKIFGVTSVNSSLVPCLNGNASKSLEKTINHLFGHERIWRNLETYLELVFPHHLDTVFAVLGVELTPKFTLEYVTERGKLQNHLLEKAIFNLQRIESSLREPNSIFGLKSMDHHEKTAVVQAVRKMMMETGVCLSKVSEETNRLEAHEERLQIMLNECRASFASHFDVLKEAHQFTTGLNSQLFTDFEATALRVTSILRRVRFTTKPKLFHWQDHRIDLREFEILYREGGKDQVEMIELMKLRKIINFDLAEAISSSTAALDEILSYRQFFIDRLGIAEAAGEQIGELREMQKCMRDIIPKLQPLRRFPFVRAEWMSRLERSVEQAQAYSPGIQYDRVNLLHIKLYYAHFKQEIIRQEKSYNIFLLLAEIGGTIGLYVGATLLTAAETFVFFIEKRTRRILLKPQYV